MSDKDQFSEDDALFDDEEISLFSLSETALSAFLSCAESYCKSLKSRSCCAEASFPGNIWSRNFCFSTWSVMDFAGSRCRYGTVELCDRSSLDRGIRESGSEMGEVLLGSLGPETGRMWLLRAVTISITMGRKWSHITSLLTVDFSLRLDNLVPVVPRASFQAFAALLP